MSFRFNFLISLPISIILASCSISMMISDNLKTDTTVLDVKGRSGGAPGEKISFGDYYSKMLERDMTASEGKNFAMTFQGIRDKLEFEVFDSVGHSSRVLCVNKVSRLELPVAGENFQVAVGDEDACFGTITLNASQRGWDFVIHNPSNFTSEKIAEGVITNGETVVQIKEVRQTSKGKLMADHILGLEFFMDDEAIGAIEMVGGGKIMIKNSVPEDIKFLIATTSFTMLMRHDMMSKGTKD